MTRYTITEMKARNREMGHHWFSPDTMRFFRSKVHSGANEHGYFITSEQREDTGPRLYTVRHYDHETGNVETMGEFQGYRFIEDARDAIRSLAPATR